MLKGEQAIMGFGTYKMEATQNTHVSAETE